MLAICSAGVQHIPHTNSVPPDLLIGLGSKSEHIGTRKQLLSRDAIPPEWLVSISLGILQAENVKLERNTWPRPSSLVANQEANAFKR